MTPSPDPSADIIGALQRYLARAEAEVARLKQSNETGWRRTRLTAWEDRALKAEAELLRLKLQYTVAECWWDDDNRRDSPEEHADEMGMQLGDEFSLQASTYWEEKFRVTKIPDAVDDDYRCEQISQKREEFEAYSEIQERAEQAEQRLRGLVEAVVEHIESVRRQMGMIPAYDKLLAALAAAQKEGI